MNGTGRVISTALQFIDGFTKPSKEAIDSMKRMGREMQKAGKQIQSAGRAISGAGSALTKSFTLPAVGAAAAALKMSNDFENAMAKVSTIADTTNTPMEALKTQVVDLSNVVGVGVTDIAEAQYQAISAGVNTAESVNFVSIAVKAAKGGFTDTTTAVDGLTTVLNAYGLEAGKAAAISDQMLAAQNFGKTSFGDMASSMGKVIPIASSLNVSTEELFSSIAVLTKNGIATSEAVTGLKAAYSNILKPSADAGKTAQQLGLDFSSAHLQSVGWAKFLDEIKEKTGGNAETMAKLFGSTEALNSVTVLAGKGSADFTKALALMGSSAGMTEDAYRKMLTPAERMNISFNKLKNSLIQFGAALTPVFDKAADIIGKVGDGLNNLSEGQVSAIVKFASIAAVMGPVITIFGKVVSTVGTVKAAWGKFNAILGSFKGLAGLVTSPAGIVIIVLAAIAAAAFLIIKNWDKIKSFLQGVGNWFKKAFAPVIPIIEAAVSGARALIGGFLQAVRPPIENIKTVFEGVAKFVKGVFAGDWKGALDGLKTIAAGALSGLLNIIKAPFRAVTNTVKGAVDAFKNLNIVKSICNAVGNVIKNVLSKCGVDVEKFSANINNIKARVTSILNGLKTVFTIAFNTIAKPAKELAGIMANIFGKKISDACRGAGVLITNFKHLAGTAFSSVAGAVKRTMNVIVPVVKVAFGAVKGAIAAAVNTVTSLISGVLTVFDGLISFISGVFTGNWRQAWEGVKSIFKGIFDTFAAICKAPINAVISIINGVISALNKINITIPDWVLGIGGKSFGINIPTIPQLYKGTDNWEGGMAMIHDRGGEIVDLPQGSRVYPHDKSVEMARREGERGGSIRINIQKLADKIEVRSDEDIDRIAAALAYKLKKVAFNTGRV